MSIVPHSLSFFKLGPRSWLPFPTMPTPDDRPLSSSLPESLRQHLYTGPRLPIDTSPHPPLPLPPLVAPADPPHPPRDRARLSSSSSASLLDLAGAAVHQTAIPTQRPIYSDPVFHTSRSSSLSRIINPSTPHHAPEDPYPVRRSWREGEAGPSSLGSAVRTSRDTGERWQQRAVDTAPSLLPRDEYPYRNSWPESESRQPRSFLSSARHNSIGRDYPGTIPAPDVPTYSRMSSSYTETRGSSGVYRRSPGHSPYSMNASTSQYGRCFNK
jgi:hypothetical protein